MRLEPQLCRNLYMLAANYADITGIALTTLSVKAGQSYDFFARMSDRSNRVIGKKGSLSAYAHDEVVDWFRKNWPEGHEMPELDDPSYSKRKR